MEKYPPGFEEQDDLRSAFIRKITLRQLKSVETNCFKEPTVSEVIPKRLVRYWHNPADLPDDVRACLRSWEILADEDFELHLFDDQSAGKFIAEFYGERELRAFRSCDHPAMRSDYLRLCFLLAEGGLYVDADDVLVGDGWRTIFLDSRLKLQPLCYDLRASAMMPSKEIWRTDLSIADHIFYVNNDPIASPAGHPILRLALARATGKLLQGKCNLDIQSTTGPGNLTAALAQHARELEMSGLAFDFELLRNWDSISEVRWNLCYRDDARNWRNVYRS